MLRVLDLFSGIGGFSLGLERTGGFKTVGFCEIDPYCRAVLLKNWPEVRVYQDIRKLTLNDLFIDQCWPIDVICGGFPCQPFSSASRGRKRGTDDDRFLWPEMLRLIREIKPRWVIGENVTHIDGLALEQVVSDLEACGYETAPPLEIPACAVGHDHRRSRIWIVGNSNGNGEPISAIHAEASGVQGDRPKPRRSRAPYGLSRGMDAYRREAIGNAVTPEIPEAIGNAIMQAEGLVA
jgi:DNA (cytosine-5)-methyltransferase 1